MEIKRKKKRKKANDQRKKGMTSKMIFSKND